MEVFWWVISGIAIVVIGMVISSALAFSWSTGAIIGLIVWLIAICIRLGALDEIFFMFSGD